MSLEECFKPMIDAINKTVEGINMNKQIGRNLKALRLSRGLSQEAAANEIGITFQQWQKYENGDNKLGGHRMGDACIALSCEPNELFKGCLGTYPADVKQNDAYARTQTEVKLLQAVRNKPAKYVKALLEVVS